MNNETIKSVVIRVTEDVFAEGFVEYTDADAEFYGKFAKALLEEQAKREEVLLVALEFIRANFHVDNHFDNWKVAYETLEGLGL